MKKVIVSGIQPTGELHIGNYLGAVKNWIDLQNDPAYDCFFFIADWHSMTIDYEPSEKQRQIKNLVADLLALGVDPNKAHIYVQSSVTATAELAWIFNTLTPMSELEKMTQYKDKSARNAENINTGLFAYPVLQAADILINKAELVPVGEDQVQHVEITRVIAKKFNNKFGKLFPEPHALLTKVPRVMSLTEPTKKMSKSHGPKTCIFISDAPDEIYAKIRKAVTDEAGIQNLLDLVELFDESGLTTAHLKKDFAVGELKNVELKDTLAELIANTFATFRERRQKITDREIKEVLMHGHEHAAKIAAHTMRAVRELVGLE